ncbi:radical SAM protein [Paenibacillus sp. N4]|uniref:SPL family radical SAM protein n=1 Tax=Paenibacillus vietnamensis TaxID=2590547 RepID=UPI001CD056B8|nr:radical SAM protein [Paenibacillus vietnamensis]MCA0754805.1 radical SAM protein [Paenibacillus vietnamensis]
MKPVYLYKTPKTMLNKGTGFLSGYSHSLNPYSGCSYGCSYCYVRQMPVATFRKEQWGAWVDIKSDAAAVFRKELARAKTKGPVTIFMSSSTDPYQPIEHKEGVTRSLLEVMCADQPDFLLVQTRSPLVTRDIDLLKRLGANVRVSMTVETDLEPIRKHFSPGAPPIPARLNALRLLAEAGVPAQAAVAPLLPSSEGFAETLRAAVDRVCVDDYFMGDGSGGRRTRSLGIEALYREIGLEEWYDTSASRLLYERFSRVYDEDRLFVSKQGFEP